MKLNDYKRLGKISIKSRKKSTHNTVRGIAFGLIIIVPIIFFALSFYLDLTRKINTLGSVSTIDIRTTHPDLTIDNSFSNQNKIPFESLPDLTGFKEVEEYHTDQYFRIYYTSSSNLTPYFMLESNKINIPTSFVTGSFENSFKIFYGDYSSSLITETERKDLLKNTDNESPYLYGTGFYGDGSKQIIISEEFLRNLGEFGEWIIGRELTLYFVIYKDQTILIDDNNDPNDAPDFNYHVDIKTHVKVFEKYKIVGVVRKELYNLPSRENEAHLWFHQSSLYNNNGVSSLPIYTRYIEEEEVKHVYTYSSDIETLASDVVNNGYLFIPLGLGVNYMDGPSPSLNVKLQCKNYQGTVNVEKEINEIYEEYILTNNVIETNSIYRHLKMINTTGQYVMLVLISFSGIILFATLLNLYNSINYSVEIRRNYIGVMRAIGAKEKMIPRLYFVEIMIIFMKTFIWVVVFGGILSFIIKLMIDGSFRDFGDILPFFIRLNFNYYLVALLIMMVFEFLIAFLYSQVACHHVAHKPILEILRDEK